MLVCVKWLCKMVSVLKCVHYYDIVNSAAIYRSNENKDKGNFPIYTKIFSKCRRCGKIIIKKS